LIGLYIGRSSVASAFGAAGSLVVLMVWVYYSAQIFLLGAEFTACLGGVRDEEGEAKDATKLTGRSLGPLQPNRFRRRGGA